MVDNDRKKTLVLFGVLCVCVTEVVAYMAISSFNVRERAENTDILLDVPEGIAMPIPERKKIAYQDRKIVSTEEYFDMLSTEEEIVPIGQEDKTPQVSSAPDKGGSAVNRVFGFAPEQPKVHDEPVVRKPYQMSNDEKLEYDRKRAEMVRDVITGETAATDSGCDEKADEAEAIDLSARDDGIISYLDEALPEVSAGYREIRPFRCMFIRDEKVSNGQRVTVRLLEEYALDGVIIPANSHLTAICKISDRLELDVKSWEINGRIIPLQLCAYDMDGLKGIYCPETLSAKNARRASDDAISKSYPYSEVCWVILQIPSYAPEWA